MKQPLKKHINAVVKTIKMWEWLRDNPDRSKQDYLEPLGIYQLIKHGCFLCYCWMGFGEGECVDSNRYGCSNCPLDNKIAKKCFAGNSAFKSWKWSERPKTKAKYAQIIVDLCKKWLKKYGLDEKGVKSDD